MNTRIRFTILLVLGIMRVTSQILLVAVYTYCLVMISIDLSETTQKSALEIRDNIRDKIQSETKFKTIFFSDKIVFPDKKENCLRLEFVSDGILSQIMSQTTYRSCISSAINQRFWKFKFTYFTHFTAVKNSPECTFGIEMLEVFYI